MKIARVFLLLTLSVVVYGNLIAAVARPAILSIGTLFAAVNQQTDQTIGSKNFMHFALEKPEEYKESHKPRDIDKEIR